MDRNLAQFLARISEFVYRKNFGADDAATIGSPSVTAFQDDRAPATSFAALCRYPDRTVLAFQGTIPRLGAGFIADWGENFTADLVERPDLGLPGRVHQGFADQLDLIHAQILDALKTPPVLPFYLTGHSQGAAIAILASQWLASLGLPPTATYTFASPRPADADFASAYRTPTYRVEFGNDIVPHVPLTKISLGLLRLNPLLQSPAAEALVSTLADGYVAMGPLTYRHLFGELEMDVSAEREAVLKLERAARLLIAGPTLVADHLPSNYVAMFDDSMIAGEIENLPDLYRALE